jgi:hypothetical protein
MKTLRVISIVLMIAGLAGVAVGQQPGLSLTFEPPSQTVALGSSVNVGLKITGLGDFTAPSLSAFDLDIAYDPAILGFTSVTFGDPVLGDQLNLTGLGAITGFASSVGSANVSELSLDSPAHLDLLQAGDFILAKLSFDAIGVGTSSLGISRGSLYDSGGDPLNANYGTGSVTVTPLPGAVLLGSLGLGSAGWLLRRKKQIGR